ncbi:MAG: formimidoylglutamate deiminase [Bacteroidetes bacterium]|nr:formimidoylglutamate deiminase [Bacteroidota bacterium]
MTLSRPVTTIGTNWALLPDGWHQRVEIGIDETGSICSLGPWTDAQVTHTLNVAIPGMINIHSHAFQRKLVGRTQRFTKSDDDFWSWRSGMYKDVAELTPTGQFECANALYHELLENGYTTVAEFQYAHGAEDREDLETATYMSEALMRASRSSGIRMLLLPVLYQQAGFGDRPASLDQRPFVLDTSVYLELMDHLMDVSRSEPLVTVGYAPHSLRAVGYDALSDLLDHRESKAPGSPLHIHVSEQVREVTECMLGTGMRPIEWLFRNFNVDSNWCMIHSTHASKAELDSIIQSGVTVGLCPTTEGDLGDGAFPLADFVGKGGNFAIGTDSNVCVSPAEEIRFIDYQARILSRKRNAFKFDGSLSAATRLYQKALEGGRAATGVRVGRIEIGSQADFVELLEDHPLSQNRSADEILSAYVYSAGRDLIGKVLVSGKPVVEHKS